MGGSEAFGTISGSMSTKSEPSCRDHEAGARAEQGAGALALAGRGLGGYIVVGAQDGGHRVALASLEAVHRRPA